MYAMHALHALHVGMRRPPQQGEHTLHGLYTNAGEGDSVRILVYTNYQR